MENDKKTSEPDKVDVKAKQDKQEQDKQSKQDIPKSLQDKDIKTTITKFSDTVKNVLQTVEDLATLEVLLPVHERMRHRLATIKKLSQARSYKVQGRWKTFPPKFYIGKIEGKKHSNDEAEIRFEVYEVWDNDGIDETGQKHIKGEKKPYYQWSERQMPDGSKIREVTNAEYRIDHEVVETIKFKKPLNLTILSLPSLI